MHMHDANVFIVLYSAVMCYIQYWHLQHLEDSFPLIYCCGIIRLGFEVVAVFLNARLKELLSVTSHATLRDQASQVVYLLVCYNLLFYCD